MMMPTLAPSSGKDKSLHSWQQGDAVWQWIEPLTDPGETVVDPFYGSGEWGHICAAMGRKWIGSDDGSAGRIPRPSTARRVPGAATEAGSCALSASPYSGAKSTTGHKPDTAVGVDSVMA